ncbi:hypothetical protein [Caballeronia calidae]|uniref:hypothetical protein n=1 Tax=Caballeronia calidae TaxID=1777139 RepID=UPI0012FD501D|nr:hypothetical protein [Caballeronia calidae]
MIPRLDQNRLFDARSNPFPSGEFVFEHRKRQKHAFAVVLCGRSRRAFTHGCERRLTLRDLARDSIHQKVERFVHFLYDRMMSLNAAQNPRPGICAIQRRMRASRCRSRATGLCFSVRIVSRRSGAQTSRRTA